MYYTHLRNIESHTEYEVAGSAKAYSAHTLLWENLQGNDLQFASTASGDKQKTHLICL